ncbi:hypothetical protein, partial [Nocardia brasiliensis]|uniref:hypothetical protein n=1 Tax=Nocardia brasiliensis TaxID=37326 RepID=UPI001F41BF72
MNWQSDCGGGSSAAFIHVASSTATIGPSNSIACRYSWCRGIATGSRSAIRDRGPHHQPAAIHIIGNDTEHHTGNTTTVTGKDSGSDYPRSAIGFSHNPFTHTHDLGTHTHDHARAAEHHPGESG